MASYYGLTSPNGANDGDTWVYSTTGETFVRANGGWASTRPMATAGVAPSAAAGAQAGGSPPGPAVVAGSTDTRGQLTFGSGSGAANGEILTVAFANPYPVMPFVAVSAANSATSYLGLHVGTQYPTGFSVRTTTGLASGQGNTVYRFSYGVIG